MKRWNIGIIGCGAAGAQHARAMRALPDRVHLAALADVNGAVGAARAQEWQAASWTQAYHALLVRPDIDAVSICLPHQLHASVACDAAGAGKHVLVEKPLATTLAEADAMIAAAEAAGVQLMVAENVCFDALYLHAAGLINAGRLGQVFLVRIAREHEMHAYLRQRPWFLNHPSGGIMYAGGIHDFALLRMLAGEIEHVYALAARQILTPMAGDDTSVALVGLWSGAAATIVESFSLKTPTPGTYGTVHGSRGSLWFGGDRLQLYTAAEDGRQDLVEEVAIPPRDTFVAELEHFLDCLDQQVPPLTTAREQRKSLVAVLAAYASMHQRERIYLADFEASQGEAPRPAGDGASTGRSHRPGA